ncbi:hypothetical protein [Prosthecobacter sp.]|uniref:hypothetical protein n=1 Tax=Prosthecobacter sp. TaxID=1965333 RepID=UPI003904D957
MSNFGRTSIRTYRDSFERTGCAKGCMIHLVLLGLIGFAVLVWAIKNRAWELRVTVELPVAKKVEEAPPEAEAK